MDAGEDVSGGSQEGAIPGCVIAIRGVVGAGATTIANLVKETLDASPGNQGRVRLMNLYQDIHDAVGGLAVSTDEEGNRAFRKYAVLNLLEAENHIDPDIRWKKIREGQVLKAVQEGMIVILDELYFDHFKICDLVFELGHWDSTFEQVRVPFGFREHLQFAVREWITSEDSKRGVCTIQNVKGAPQATTIMIMTEIMNNVPATARILKGTKS